MPVFSDEEGQALLFENFIVQRIFYFPSAVGKTGKLHERIHGQAVKKGLSDGFKIQTVRGIRSEGHDRQGY